MHDPAEPAGDPGLVDLAFVLLLMQAGFGLLSALGLLVFVAAAGGGGVALPVSFMVPVALIVVAAGVSGRRRWAWIAALVFEALILLGDVFRLAEGRALAFDLVSVTTTVALPIAVSALLHAESPRLARRTGLAGAAAERLQHAA